MFSAPLQLLRRQARYAIGFSQRVAQRATGWIPTFQSSAFLSYAPGRDYALPPPRRGAAPTAEGAFPVPSAGSGYPGLYREQGREHTEAMLEIVGATGFELRPGDRVLDLGCGPGRMIRHLVEVAQTCEVWGLDIAASQIVWCQQTLSPPFHFATITKVPHLPFEDRSLDLIYCGSLFTHIDDLADAWLLELARVLSPRGRLYITIHDEHTMDLLQAPPYVDWEAAKRISSAKLFREAGPDFGMFTVGRDEASQVYYHTDFFREKAGHAFEVVSRTAEAYLYQTAYVLRRKGSPTG